MRKHRTSREIHRAARAAADHTGGVMISHPGQPQAETDAQADRCLSPWPIGSSGGIVAVVELAKAFASTLSGEQAMGLRPHRRPVRVVEFSMHSGIVLENPHPHAVWRDKATDYGGTTR